MVKSQEIRKLFWATLILCSFDTWRVVAGDIQILDKYFVINI